MKYRANRRLARTMLLVLVSHVPTRAPGAMVGTTAGHFGCDAIGERLGGESFLVATSTPPTGPRFTRTDMNTFSTFVQAHRFVLVSNSAIHETSASHVQTTSVVRRFLRATLNHHQSIQAHHQASSWPIIVPEESRKVKRNRQPTQHTPTSAADDSIGPVVTLNCAANVHHRALREPRTS